MYESVYGNKNENDLYNCRAQTCCWLSQKFHMRHIYVAWRNIQNTDTRIKLHQIECINLFVGFFAFDFLFAYLFYRLCSMPIYTAINWFLCFSIFITATTTTAAAHSVCDLMWFLVGQHINIELFDLINFFSLLVITLMSQSKICTESPRARENKKYFEF